MMQNNKHIPKGYKDSPLGVIPQEWQVKEFGVIASRVKDRYNPSNNNNVKCLELEHFEQDMGIINGWVNAAELKSIKNVFNKGDILFGKLRPYLKKYWIAEFQGVCSSEIWVLQANTKICLNNYLYRIIQTHRFIQIANVSSGSKMPRADWDYVSMMPMLLPPLEEQRRIAEVLGCWDEAIERQGRMVSLLTTRKRALMQRLLTPKPHWQKTKLSEIAERVTRKNTENNTNVMTISAQRGFVSQTDFFNKSIASEITDNYFLVHKDEFCYNKSYCNGYPMGAIKRLNNADKAVVTTLYICFRIKCSKCSIDFLEHFFEAGLLNKHLMKIANEGGRAHGLLNVTPTDFFAIQINIPPFAEQRETAEKLSTADVEIDLARRHLDLLRTQKQALMQQLLTGKKQLQ